MQNAANDNHAPILRPVLLVGTVGEGGRVTITDPDFWREREPPPFPSDPREA